MILAGDMVRFGEVRSDSMGSFLKVMVLHVQMGKIAVAVVYILHLDRSAC